MFRFVVPLVQLVLLIAVILGSSSYFSTDFKIGFAISFAKGFVSLCPGIFNFFTTFEKNEFSSSATWVKVLSSPATAFFSFDLTLSKRQGLTVSLATSLSVRFA